MFEQFDVIDQKYLVDGICCQSGGMGEILFVTPLSYASTFRVVLKYCKSDNEEQLKRFRREVRLLDTFRGNSKIVQILDKNLDFEPPYFVMKHYQDGDLSVRIDALKESTEGQEDCFLKMIECIQELHSRGEFHRDIKPQNFLRDGNQVVVSDLGLSTEIDSATRFTTSSAVWGTHGFIPPEFLVGGFKNADAPGDIYMLGKTFYVLLTGREPMYLTPDGIPAPLFHVIERCCCIQKSGRYQTLSDLKQSLVVAYDVLLGRAGGEVQQLLTIIKDRFEQTQQYRVEEISELVEKLAMTERDDQIQACYDLPPLFFAAVAQRPLTNHLPAFLVVYEVLVDHGDYGWGYAETIAQNMGQVFRSADALPKDRAMALDLAVRAADSRNRFAAMDKCQAMVRSVDNNDLGLHVAQVLLKHEDTFLSAIEASECKNDVIKNAIRKIKMK
jgi:serine/threonine protein kinase